MASVQLFLTLNSIGRNINTVAAKSHFAEQTQENFVQLSFAFYNTEMRGLKIQIVKKITISLFTSITINFPIDHNLFDFFGLSRQSRKNKKNIILSK